MKLASFNHQGRDGWGAVQGDSVADLSAMLGAQWPSLRHAITDDALGKLREACTSAQLIPLAQVSLQLPVRDPGKIICIGRNYRDHVAEGSAPLPQQPEIFLRTIDSLVPHGGQVHRPAVSTSFDYEGELAVVIGKGGRSIQKSDALGHVAGYTIFEDGSIRDYQRTHSLVAGKNFHRSGAMGPWIVTSDEIPDPSRLILSTRLNGEQMQRSGTDMLIFDVPTLISYLSDVFLLAPGDIISTGTPAGVGAARKPPRWLVPGDRLQVEISAIGTLAVDVA